MMGTQSASYYVSKLAKAGSMIFKAAGLDECSCKYRIAISIDILGLLNRVCNDERFEGRSVSVVDVLARILRI